MRKKKRRGGFWVGGNVEGWRLRGPFYVQLSKRGAGSAFSDRRSIMRRKEKEECTRIKKVLGRIIPDLCVRKRAYLSPLSTVSIMLGKA